MRSIINISLPQELKKEVETAVKHGGYSTTSEFFRHLVREYRLARELEQSRLDIRKGKGKVLRSFKDIK